MFTGLKEKIAQSKLKKTYDSRVGLKFVAALTVIVSVLMALGTVFVARMLTERQERAIETRGREMGMFLGKACSESIVRQDAIGIDSLVSEAVKSSEDMLYTVVLDAAGAAPLSTRQASFSPDNPELRQLLGADPAENALALAAKARQLLNPIEVSVEIRLEREKLGAVVMGFSREGVRKNARNIVWLLLGTSVAIVLLLSGLVSVMVNRMIIAQTREAEVVASNIAAGDLTQPVRVRSTDELGQLGRGLNRMIIGLKGMIVSVRDAAQGVSAVSDQVKALAQRVTAGSREQAEAVEEAASSVNEMHFSLKEIAASVEDLHRTSEHTTSAAIETAASVAEVARTMSDLSTSIEEASTAITQMSAAIREIAEHVELLSSAADETAASAAQIRESVKEVESNAGRSAELAAAVAADAKQLGMRSIEKTMEGMQQIEATVRRNAEVINRLGERAENIGSILTVIEDITDQTGLLALNAAILAAQAGEHGKGFAVVASEIRELANRTSASTKEIGDLITTVQAESREAVEAMREGVTFVEQGARLTADAGDALRKILDRAVQSQDMSRNISNAATEQTKGIRQVSEAVERITSMAHQIAAATNQQKTGSEQIMRATERMREITGFVKTSTGEQAKGSREITKSVESMTEKIALVNRAAGEVQAGSELIVNAIERIKQIAKENAGQAAAMDADIRTLSGQASALSGEIAKFKTGGAGPSGQG
jgi:methyl-accepting chemotaxis protein